MSTYADQRAHDVTWMTAAERAQYDARMRAVDDAVKAAGRDARIRTLRRIVAAGMAGIVVTRHGQLCSGGREPIPYGTHAAEDAAGWIYCLEHIPEPQN